MIAPKPHIARRMPFERTCNRRQVLFAGAAIGVAWVCGGCSDDEEDDPIWHSIHYADAALEQGFQTMYARLSPEDRAIIDNEILKRKDVLIHIIRGKLSKEESRGGSSTPHWNAEKDGRCSRSQHPDVKGVRKLRDWDLMYDAQRADASEKETGIQNPIDVLLYHEIFGHILRVLRDPALYRAVARNEQRKDEFEDEARVIENRYRKYRRLRLFPVPPKGSTP